MSDTIIVRRTGQAPLRVRGEIIAKGESSWNNAAPHYSGSTGRKQDVKIIKTSSGKYVAAIQNMTQWQGEHDTDEAAVCPSLKQCVDWLGDHIPHWMLEEIISDVGEDNVAEDVD
jgi:hypothetical protein